MNCDSETLAAAAIAAGYTKFSTQQADGIELFLLCALANSGGGGGGSDNISGAGSPLGVVTPTAVNQFYRDTTGNALWQSTGLTDADWTQWI